jgi:hypothetical protein
MLCNSRILYSFRYCPKFWGFYILAQFENCLSQLGKRWILPWWIRLKETVSLSGHRTQFKEIRIVLGKWPNWRTFLFYVSITILYTFRATSCSSSGESIVSIQHLVCVTLYRWPFLVQVGKFPSDLRTKRSPTVNRVTYTRCCIDTIDSPDDEHEVARNM